MGKLLNKELRLLGALEVDGGEGGVRFSGDLEMGYRVCLWSRFASRVMLNLVTLTAADQDALYRAVRGLPWEEHVPVDGTLAIGVTGRGAGIDNSHFGAQRIKDAIVDRFQAREGRRPSVDLATPDVRIHCHLHRDSAQLSLDLSGDGLHRRGYRVVAGEAPLKENLAAALLQLAGWRSIARAGAPFMDPMCGSGTILIEAAWMAADIAPGILREYYGFLRWQGHDAELWETLLDDAKARREAGLRDIPVISGFDNDANVIRKAESNIRVAGLADRVELAVRDVAQCRPSSDPAVSGKHGLIATNPPYGVRLGDDAGLFSLHSEFGRALRAHCPDWRVAVITPRRDLATAIGVPIDSEHELFNGAIESIAFRMRVPARAGESEAGGAVEEPASEFANRLRKNLRALAKWARKEEIECYRVYDADLPDYAFAVDLYGQHAHVQEYAPPKTVDPTRAAARRADALAAIRAVLELPPERVHFKMRERQRGTAQYERNAQTGRRLKVHESGLTFIVNLDDYLDTGLFLDHRPLRSMVREQARGKRVLNLFAYTGSFSVHAAAGGARTTTTVDMSRTYLDWARDNMATNGFTGVQHRYEHADCLQWLAQSGEEYDLIVLDPPSFSNSARMEDTLDVQRDHVDLIEACMARLSPGGVLFFSNNLRGFRIDAEALRAYALRDISAQTVPLDFKRRPNIHHCWEIRHGG